MVNYVFDPDVVHECGLKGVGLPKPQMFDAVADALEEAYPGHIDHDQPWIYSIAGGAMIQMKVYFASIHEYIIIWGTPIGSEGHSGRHACGFWDTVLEGETWYYAEGQFDKLVYGPGDRIYVGPGQARGMRFLDGLWALEYERGPLPLSIPFGLADEVLSTLDFSTALQTLGVYMDLVGRHWTNPDAEHNPLLAPFKRLVGKVPKTIGPLLTGLTQPAAPYDDIPDDEGNLRPLEEVNRAETPGVSSTGRASRKKQGKRRAASAKTSA